jgi:ATP-dependent Clp protease adaptor protein ClpS
MPNSQTQTDVKTRATIRYPGRYHVMIHNDDHTPMEFVISLLVEVFDRDVNTARDITMAVHNQGRAAAGTYFYEVAEQKAAEASAISKHNRYPLKITLEEV